MAHARRKDVARPTGWPCCSLQEAPKTRWQLEPASDIVRAHVGCCSYIDPEPQITQYEGIHRSADSVSLLPTSPSSPSVSTHFDSAKSIECIHPDLYFSSAWLSMRDTHGYLLSCMIPHGSSSLSPHYQLLPPPNMCTFTVPNLLPSPISISHYTLSFYPLFGLAL